MYIRVKRFRRIEGIKTYYYVVRGVRDDHGTRQHVVKYLGSIESIMEKMEIAEQIMKKEYKRITLLRGGNRND